MNELRELCKLGGMRIAHPNGHKQKPDHKQASGGLQAAWLCNLQHPMIQLLDFLETLSSI
jgi:hypothetical protein